MMPWQKYAPSAMRDAELAEMLEFLIALSGICYRAYLGSFQWKKSTVFCFALRLGLISKRTRWDKVTFQRASSREAVAVLEASESKCQLSRFLSSALCSAALAVRWEGSAGIIGSLLLPVMGGSRWGGLLDC